MKKNPSVILGLSALILFASCGEDSPVEPVGSPAPELVGCSPENGAADIKGSSLKVVFTFDQNVKCPLEAQKGVSVSGKATVKSVNAYGVDFTVEITGLEENGESYTLTVPAGTVQGFKENQPGATAVSFKFTMHYIEPEKEYDRNPAKALTNKNATPQAKSLYDYLLSQYGKKTISGAMGGTAWETSYTDMIAEKAGRYPGIVGFDYLFNNWPAKYWTECPDYSDITPVKKAWEAGNIIQIGWHWCVPKSESADITKDGDSYGYNHKDFGVDNALKEGTWQNKEMKKQLSQIAGYLKLLQEAEIPVLWRPLHEAAGDYGWGAWFWWGYDGPEACRRLWRYMHEYLVNDCGLDNLIWVWTAQTTDKGKLTTVDNLEAWYPGDAYVDIVGADLYVDKHTTQSKTFKLVNNSVKGSKMVVLSEFGNLLDIDGYFSEDAPWGYFMNWCNFEDGKPVTWCKDSNGAYTWNNSADDWKAALANSHTINRKDIPSLK